MRRIPLVAWSYLSNVFTQYAEPFSQGKLDYAFRLLEFDDRL